MRVIGFGRLSAVVITSMFVVGCSHDTGPSVPAGAMQVSSGDKTIAFTAPHDGRIYLRDDNDNSVVYSGEVRKDQVVKYDSVVEQVMVDGSVTTQKVANANHDHSWYFERSSRSDQAEAASGTVRDSSGAEIPTIRVPVGVKVDVQTQPSEAK
jgi:hypothetical protein